jgi:hypothetical protein
LDGDFRSGRIMCGVRESASVPDCVAPLVLVETGLPGRCAMRKILYASFLFAVAATCCTPPPRSVDNVVLISIDSLRADHVGAYGYAPPTSPTLDSLAATGVRFERAYSTTSWTLPAHAALLSGWFDESHGATESNKTIAPGVPMLAEALSRAGIATTGIFSGPYLDPSFGFDRGFDTYVSAASSTWAGAQSKAPAPHQQSHADVTNPRMKARLEEWLAIPRTGHRNFLFLHMWDVHYDYVAPQRYVDLFDPNYTGTLDASNFPSNKSINPNMDRRDFQHLLALYDAEIRYTDDTIRELLDLLKKAGLLENTAVIVASDHGDEFLEHGGRGHMKTLYEEVLHIPLILHLFGQPSTASSVPSVVSLVDVFPTVCELFMVDCQYQGPGESLAGYLWGKIPPKPRNSALAQLTFRLYGVDQNAVVRQKDKLIRWNSGHFMRYFRLLEDGNEQNPIELTPLKPTYSPDDARSALALMDRMLKESTEAGIRLGKGGASLPPQLGEETRQHLRALGYME